MIGDFNIDGGVVGEQAHFIGVNFVLVFSRQLCSKNGAILPRAGNEDYRPGKGVKDMLAFILQTAVQSAAQYSHPPKASYCVASPRRTTAYCLRRRALSETFGGWLYIFHTLNNKIDDFHHRAYSDMSLRYFGDVACPVFPMGTDDSGIETRSISPILNGNAVCSSGL